MTASIYHGKAAKAYWGSTGWTAFLSVIEWSCTLTADVAESTVMAASNYGKTREVGFKSGTASVTCLAQDSTDVALTEGSSYTLELWRSATSGDKGYSGAAICTGIDYGVDMNDMETVAYNFQLTGTITSTLGAS